LLLMHARRCQSTTTTESLTATEVTDAATDTQTTPGAADLPSTMADLTARRPTHTLSDRQYVHYYVGIGFQWRSDDLK